MKIAEKLVNLFKQDSDVYERFIYVIRDGKRTKRFVRPKGQRPKMSKASRDKLSRSMKKSQKVKQSARRSSTKLARRKSLIIRKRTHL
jgi:hypothetical protein